MLQTFRLVGRAALLAAVGGVCAGTASAETVAWWRFEDGVAGTSVTATQNFTVYAQGVVDASGNGNHLVARNTSNHAVLYSDDIPPVVAGPNSLSIRNATNGSGGLSTWSVQTRPTLDAEFMVYDQFTIEAFFKPAESDVKGWNTIVGWDGGERTRRVALAEETEAFKFYRLAVTAVRTGGNDPAQVAELILEARDGSRVTAAGQDSAGTATTSSEAYNPGAWDERAFKAFDNDPGTRWTSSANLNAQNPAWLQFELIEPASIVSYSVMTREDNGNRHPKDWTLYGSHNGTDWIEIDSRTGMDSYPASADATLYFQLVGEEPFGRLRINYLDVTARRHMLYTPNPLLADHWYYAAAIMDGPTLNIYLADLTAGETEPTLVATMNLPVEGGSTALVPRADYNPSSAPSPRRTWSVGRGFYGNNNGDQVEGVIDEVRLSNHAVAVSELLLSIGVPVELDSFVIE